MKLSMRWKVALALASLTCGGCGPATKTIHPDSESQAAVESGQASAIPEAAVELEAAGVEVGRDATSGRVTSVDFGSVPITDELSLQLAKLTACQKLTIRESSMSDTGWQELANLTQVQHLDLRNCSLNDSQLQAIVSGMPDLLALRLSGQNGATVVEDTGLTCLTTCPKLKVLAADELWISADGLEHLAHCEQLSELYLKGTLVDDAAMEILANKKRLSKLRLAKTGVTAVGLEKLSSLPLTDLDVSECTHVVDEAMVPIGKLVTLERLNLWRDVVTDDGVQHLAELKNLQWLNLDNTHLSDAGLKHLKGFDRLTFLHLGSTSVTDAGMPDLVGLTSLKDLKVTRTGVTDAGVRVVQTAIPGVDVQLKYIEGQ
ncbi:MAG: hypothetical protein R3C53_08150 [Pirellulaceae bacterium]